MTSALAERLRAALDARGELLRAAAERGWSAALRLFNGYSEGQPGLVAELYGRTLVLLNHAAQAAELTGAVNAALDFYRAALPGLESALVKTRHAVDEELRRGEVAWGSRLARRVREGEIWYALDLRLNQDTSFYIDARELRAWLAANSAGLEVLNTFAYTGSLGTACAARGAGWVLQSDLNRRFLNLGKDSYALNGLPVRRADFLAQDFFHLAAQLRRSQQRFDLVILDPPFFSASPAGRVDLVGEAEALVNKVRPLVREGGRLVVVNNALYVSGRAFLTALANLSRGKAGEHEDELGWGGWLELERIIPVPADAAGFPPLGTPWPAEPAPFNHPTKIAVLRVHREEGEQDTLRKRPI